MPARPAHIDPDVEYLSAALARSGRTDKQVAAAVGAARHSKMSPSTVAALRNLATRRPQNYTLLWVGYALGLRRAWVPV